MTLGCVKFTVKLLECLRMSFRNILYSHLYIVYIALYYVEENSLLHWRLTTASYGQWLYVPNGNIGLVLEAHWSCLFVLFWFSREV